MKTKPPEHEGGWPLVLSVLLMFLIVGVVVVHDFAVRPKAVVAEVPQDQVYHPATYSPRQKPSDKFPTDEELLLYLLLSMPK